MAFAVQACGRSRRLRGREKVALSSGGGSVAVYQQAIRSK